MPKICETAPANPARRSTLKLGAASGAAALVGSEFVPTPASAQVVVPVPSPPTTPFVVPLPLYSPKLPVASLNPLATPAANVSGGECGRDAHQAWVSHPPQKFYEVDVKAALHSWHPELPTQTIWGYDGLMPGPTFVARYGEPVLVRFHNNLPLSDPTGFGSPEISTHLHNLHTPSASDGYAGDYYSSANFGPTLTAAGFWRDHHYPNAYAGLDKYPSTNGDPREALGTLWYHDHRMDFTAPNTYRGLAGFYLLFDEVDSGNETDTNPKALRLPSGVGPNGFDVPLVFHDKQFDASGFLFFDQFEPDGILGDKFCVNGKIQPFFKVKRRKYRFRLLDGGPSRFYEFYLTYNGRDQVFDYIANDGNLLPAPLKMSKVRLGVAERADIVIDFSRFPAGAQLFLVNRLEQTSGRGPSGNLLAPGTPVLRFDVEGPAVADPSRVPLKLRELPPYSLSEAKITREFQFGRLNGVWTINDKIFDASPNAPRVPVKAGTAEIWTLRTGGGWSHPIHIHFEEGRIIDRNGIPPPPHERGRKDVYVLGPGDTVRVFLRFRDFPGKFMMHCHNTTHEDHAMMLRFDIVA